MTIEPSTTLAIFHNFFSEEHGARFQFSTRRPPTGLVSLSSRAGFNIGLVLDHDEFTVGPVHPRRRIGEALRKVVRHVDLAGDIELVAVFPW